MCRAYGKSFRKSVLLSVALIGVYVISSAVLSSYGTLRPYYYKTGKGYFERESSEGWRQGDVKEDSWSRNSKQTLSHGGIDLAEVVNVSTKTPPWRTFSSISSSSPPTTNLARSSGVQSSPSQSPGDSKPQKKESHSKVLLIYDKNSSSIAKEIRTLLQSHRIPHDLYLYNKQYLLPLESEGKARYCAIVVVDILSLYRNWSDLHRQHLFQHSKRFDVTLIHFVNLLNTSDSREFKIPNLVFWLAEDVDLVGIDLNKEVDFYYLKTEETITPLPSNTVYAGMYFLGKDWHLREAVEASWKSRDEVRVLAEMKFKRRMKYRGEGSLPVVVAGEWEAGVKQVLVGTPPTLWLTKLLFLEVLRLYVGTHALARFGRERLVMVDIDDVFVAPRGLKMTSSDVEVSVCDQCWCSGCHSDS